MSILTKRELASLMLHRVAKEPSRAQPKHYYADPASHVLFESERRAKAEAKAKRNR